MLNVNVTCRQSNQNKNANEIIRQHDKVYAVLDTNILVSAIWGASKMSNPTRVLAAVMEGKLIPLYNDEILSEYREVLSRDRFQFDQKLVDEVLSTIVTCGVYLERTQSDEYAFLDHKDIVFYEVSLSKKNSFLVTGNLKHFPKESFVISPSAMVKLL